MSDDSWWDRTVETVGNTVVEVFKIIVIVMVLGSALNLFADREVYLDKYRAFTTNCEKLLDELKEDDLCVANPSCTMTRDELSEHSERKERWNKYCVENGQDGQ